METSRPRDVAKQVPDAFVRDSLDVRDVSALGSLLEETQEFRRLLKKASIALEILILRNKIMMI